MSFTFKYVEWPCHEPLMLKCTATYLRRCEPLNRHKMVLFYLIWMRPPTRHALNKNDTIQAIPLQWLLWVQRRSCLYWVIHSNASGGTGSHTVNRTLICSFTASSFFLGSSLAWFSVFYSGFPSAHYCGVTHLTRSPSLEVKPLHRIAVSASNVIVWVVSFPSILLYAMKMR